GQRDRGENDSSAPAGGDHPHAAPQHGGHEGPFTGGREPDDEERLAGGVGGWKQLARTSHGFVPRREPGRDGPGRTGLAVRSSSDASCAASPGARGPYRAARSRSRNRMTWSARALSTPAARSARPSPSPSRASASGT